MFFLKILTGHDFTEKNVLSSNWFMKVSNMWGYFGIGASILFAGVRMPELKFVLVADDTSSWVGHTIGSAKRSVI